ncbi:HlyD family secretion protein [Lewinella sp. LCG006]|uniref:HlyD family secretion protein n=1 Tax=Lewinella sp. LCG006 TaxID=3231911 RepID=UPI0034609279
MKINPVYVLMLIGLLVLVPLARKIQQRPTAFYGIAENQDIDLSLEHAVMVKRILVKEGEAVKAGQLLMVLERTNIPFLRASLLQEKKQLDAERQELLTKNNNRREELNQAQAAAAFELENQLTQLLAQQAQNERLLAGLESVSTSAIAKETPEITALKAEQATVTQPYILQKNNLQKETKAELNSLTARLEKIDLELAELEREFQTLELKSPIDGVIGKVNFVPGEQPSSRETLLNIYRLHPDQVTTYIPEGQLTSLQLGDSLVVRSIQDQEYVISGQIIGLGNKIRELPIRMRRDPEVQAWGREVLLKIPDENALMQGERVLIEQIID